MTRNVCLYPISATFRVATFFIPTNVPFAIKSEQRKQIYWKKNIGCMPKSFTDYFKYFSK